MIKESKEVRAPDPNGTNQEDQTVNYDQHSSWTLQRVNRRRASPFRWVSQSTFWVQTDPIFESIDQQRDATASSDNKEPLTQRVNAKFTEGDSILKTKGNIFILKRQQNHRCDIYILDLIQNCHNNHEVSTCVSMWTWWIKVFFFFNNGLELSGCATAPLGWKL